MSQGYTRREVLGGIGTGALSLVAVGPVAAGGTARYIASTQTATGRDRIESAGFRVQRSLAGGRVHLVVGPADAREDLAGVSGVSHAVADIGLRLDAPALRASQDTHLPAPSVPDIHDDLYYLQWDKDVTNVPAAHDTATGDGRSLAVIDTGVALDHPNLSGNLDASAGRRFRAIAVGSSFEEAIAASEPVQTGSGDVEIPVDRGDPTQGTTVLTDAVERDVNGHGTHVSGIAAADPTAGNHPVTGTAPDATVVPLRVFYYLERDFDVDGDGEVEEGVADLFTTTGDILAAIDYAAAVGVDAMNMSIGTAPIPPQDNSGRFRPIYQTVIQSAVRRGTVVVVSAGNAEADLQSGVFTVPNSVAGAMSISATAPNDELAFYSNFGTNELDVGAPGGGYETLAKSLDPVNPDWPYPTNLVFNTYAFPGSDQRLTVPDFNWLAGTSMAAPQVTGTAALLREAAPDANAKQIEQAIEEGADLVDGKSDPEFGAGRLDVRDALDSLPF